MVALSLAYSDPPKDKPWVLLAVPMVAGLIVLRRWPVIGLMLIVAGAVGHHVRQATSVEPIDLAVPFALFTLANTDGLRRAAKIACVVLLLGVVALTLAQPSKVGIGPDGVRAGPTVKVDLVPVIPIDSVKRLAPKSDRAAVAEPNTVQRTLEALWRAAGLVLLLGFAYLLGDNVRARRLHLATLEQRAADLEREQR